MNDQLASLARLIADLYAQIASQQQQVAALEAKLKDGRDA